MQPIIIGLLYVPNIRSLLACPAAKPQIARPFGERVVDELEIGAILVMTHRHSALVPENDGPPVAKIVISNSCLQPKG